MSEEIKTGYVVHVEAGVLYAEDAIVNGVGETDDSPSMPLLRKSEIDEGEWVWDITIDADTGRINGWPDGVTAKTFYKVCDCCKVMVDGFETYYDYVPDFLSIYARGYGDYVYVEVGPDGIIKDWSRERALKFIAENMTKKDER